MDKAQRYAYVKAYVGDETANCSTCRGSPNENIIYCTKEESRVEGPWEWGTRPKGQGARSDLNNLVEFISPDTTLQEIAENFPVPFIKYSRGIQNYLFTLRIPKEAFIPVQVEVYWGATGSGKSHRAVTENPNNFMLTSDRKEVWFDGYCNEKCLIIDDFYGWLKWGFLLATCDGYKKRAPTKGGFIWGLWSKVIFTSNVPPREWYSRDKISDTMFAAFERRINVCIEMNEPFIHE